MKTKQIILTFTILALSSALVSAAPLGTAFTYQGRLADGGNPANGSYDLEFILYSAPIGNTVVAGPITNVMVSVTNGSFAVGLDFGADAFDGNARWLGIAVRTNGGETFTLLNPRQPLTPSPYALYAPSAGAAATAGSASSVAAANVTGSLALAQLPPVVLTNNQTEVTVGELSISNLHLPAMSGDAGAIYAGGDSLIHGDASGNFFVGPGAGNPYMSGMDNLGVGTYALRNNASGQFNMAVGYYALSQNTVGWFNTANGIQALGNNTNGFNNTAQGFGALYVNTSGSANTAVGYAALTLSTGSGNIALGYNAGSSLTNGDNNIAIGNMGGENESNTIRLGTPGTHFKTYIAGVINGDGGGLTNLNAGQLSGTLADARLSANVALRSGGNTFSNEQSFQGNIRLNNMKLFLRDGSDPNHALGFYDSSQPFAGVVLDGPVLSGFSGGALGNKQGFDEEIVLCWQGGYVGIGTAYPTSRLQVAGTVQGTAFIGDGSGLTSLNAVNVTGTLNPPQIPDLDAAKITSGAVADARLSANVALLNNSQTFSGAKTFSANVTATASLRLNGLLRAGSETGPTYPSYPPNPDGSTGLVIRRLSSTTTSSNSVVARTDRLTLIRDGTASGLNIVFGSGGPATINATGITRTGTVVTRVLSTFSPPAWTVVFSDAQKVVHYDITFGDIYDTSHTCHVVLDRFDDGVESDYFMVGTLTSTYNQ